MFVELEINIKQFAEEQHNIKVQTYELLDFFPFSAAIQVT